MTLHALTVGLLVALAVLAGTVTLHLLFHRMLRGVRWPERPVARLLHWHVLLALIGGALATAALVFAVAHGLGGRFNRTLHIRPTGAEVRAGAQAPPRFSLARYLPPVLDQGNTLACGAFAASEALYAERAERGERLGSAAWSPFYNYAYAAGGQNSGTTLDQEAQAYILHGVVPWDAQPQMGWPTQSEIALALGQGGSYYYLFYSPAGQAGLQAIKGAIAKGHPVILLIAVNSSFENAFGASWTNNDGPFSGGYHFIVAYGYQGNSFQVRNSWGSDWGQNGSITFTPQAMLRTVLAAGVILPGAVAWPLPVPPPVPPTPPVGPPTPTPQPLPVHATPGATLGPFAPVPRAIVMVRKQDLRDRPRADAGRLQTVYPGAVLATSGQQTPHWIVGQTQDRRARGWIDKRNARIPAH